jgi:uncharacterized protein (DUF427 family)
MKPSIQQSSDKLVKVPGPDHPITITPNTNRVRVTFAGKIIADTTRAFTLREAGYQPVHYVPREDTDLSLLTPTDHSSYCPYKGDASYFTISADGRTSENAVWSYQQPYPAVKEIKDHLAFYRTRVDGIEESRI